MASSILPCKRHYDATSVLMFEELEDVDDITSTHDLNNRLEKHLSTELFDVVHVQNSNIKSIDMKTMKRLFDSGVQFTMIDYENKTLCRADYDLFYLSADQYIIIMYAATLKSNNFKVLKLDDRCPVKHVIIMTEDILDKELVTKGQIAEVKNVLSSNDNVIVFSVGQRVYNHVSSLFGNIIKKHYTMMLPLCETLSRLPDYSVKSFARNISFQCDHDLKKFAKWSVPKTYEIEFIYDIADIYELEHDRTLLWVFTQDYSFVILDNITKGCPVLVDKDHEIVSILKQYGIEIPSCGRDEMKQTIEKMLSNKQAMFDTAKDNRKKLLESDYNKTAVNDFITKMMSID